MNFVYIYGPPGVGKLTVAEELAKLTGYKIFHNHMSIDHAALIFKFGTKEFNELVGRYRLYTIDVASRSKLEGMIATFVYAHPEDDKYTKKVMRLVKGNGGRFLPVRLYCDEKLLFERIKNESRKAYGKIKHAKKLRMLLKGYKLFEPMPFVKSLSIDNTNLSPKKAAQKIARHYRL